MKRLRPADLFPYRYDAPQPTTWLWMSEGVTDYYADLALVRSGFTDEATFLATVLGKIDGVDQRPATALEDASLQAWLCDDRRHRATSTTTRDRWPDWRSTSSSATPRTTRAHSTT